MLNIIKVVLTIVFLLDKLCIVILSFLSVLFKDLELLIKYVLIANLYCIICIISK